MHHIACSSKSTSVEAVVITIISCLGLIVTLKHFIPFLRWVFKMLFRSEKDLIRCYGSWAMVTGATDGIGKAIAYELAQRGLNLILVSRSFKKLEIVATEIRKKHSGSLVEVIQMDFSGDMSRGLRQVAAATRDLDLGVVINNAGITYPGAMFFDEIKEKVWMEIVKVNVEGTSRVIKAVLPGMLTRKRGAIVNIGSGAASVLSSHPLYTVYAATKAYVDQLSRSLHMEYKQHGIHVQCQVPMYVATKMVSKVANIKRESLFIPTAEGYAKAAIRKIGQEARCTPYWSHLIQWCFADIVPNPVLDAWRLAIGLSRRNRERITNNVNPKY